MEISRQLAEKYDFKNAVFEVGDVTRLPFDNGCFDVVNCCDILAYIPDIAAVLSEVRRVLRPGGLVHCREMIIDACFAHPHYEAMKRGWEIFADLLLADDGHPQIGKDLHFRLEEAGFANLRMSPIFETYAEAEDVQRFYTLVRNWFLADEIAQAAQSYGAAMQEELVRLSEALELWKDQPGAHAAIAFGRAIGVRP